MTALARAGWHTLTLDEFANPRTTHDERRTFLLTFDDGYASLAEYAYPVLADLGFTATTFLITDYIGKPNTWDVRYTWNRLRHLSWTQIDEWRARGFDFASHGATHRRLTWLDDATVETELTGSRDALTSRLGSEGGRAIAYPFGAVDERVLSAALTNRLHEVSLLLDAGKAINSVLDLPLVLETILRSAAELLGGTLAVRSSPGKGAAVTLRLPIPVAEGFNGQNSCTSD